MSRKKDIDYKELNGSEYEILTIKEFEDCELEMPSRYDEEIEYIEKVAVHWDEFEADLADDYWDESCDATQSDFEGYVEHIGEDYVGESKCFPSRTSPDIRVDVNSITIACVHIGSDYVYFDVIIDRSSH